MKISILIPCYNEEKGIGKVIDGIPLETLSRLGFETEIIVINNNSTDKTAQIAKEKNVIVINEKKKGKGYAMKTGFDSISPDSEFIVMLDGDNSYSSSEIPRIIEPLVSNFCDVVVGSRLGGKINKGSLKFQNRLANWGYTFLVRQLYRANTTDVLSGYFGWKREVVDRMKPHIKANGFAIEMEMIIRSVKLGYEIYSVPVTYDQREGESKLNPLKDGAQIMGVFVKNIFWSPKKENQKRKISFRFTLNSKH